MSIFLLLIVGLLGCEEFQTIPLHLDGPSAVAVIPQGATPFFDAVGFVANQRDGTIRALQLKENRYLTDDAVASFLPAAPIATGARRLITDLVAVTDGQAITLWAADNATRTLIQVPYIMRWEDGAPVEFVPTSTDPVFVDADGSGDGQGDNAALTEVRLRGGYTTTEDWYVEYDGSRWWVKGSASGVQVGVPVAGERYRTDMGQLEFVLTGSATAGDRLEIRTETGIQQWVYDGAVLGLMEQGGRVFASLAGPSPQILVVDGLTGLWQGAIPLPAGSQPGRMTQAADGRIWVADGGLPVVHEIALAPGADPATAIRTEIAAAAPVLDVAWSAGADREGAAYEHLFVAPVGLQRVDVWDLSLGAWHDPEPATAEAEGIWLGVPVSGLAASVGSVWLQQPDEDGAYPRVPVVAVSTQDGVVHPLDASTGCVVQTYTGPQGPDPYYDATDEVVTVEDLGPTSSPILWLDEQSGHQIVTSGCGGLVRNETWTVTYDSLLLSWEVEGTVSGVQSLRAREDERYVSDEGGISFLILAGNLPSTDGDRFSFSTDAGTAVMSGTDLDRDGDPDLLWELPMRPVAFSYTGGPVGGGWDEVQRREFMLLPVLNSDVAVKISLDTMDGNIYWN